MISIVCPAFCMAVDSVTSRRRLWGARPVWSRMRATSSTTAGDTNWRYEMFTPSASSPSDGFSRCHRRSWRKALISTSLPSGTMRPVSSAMEMKSLGITSARVG